MSERQVTYAEAIVASDALAALSKIGSKDGAILKRTAQMLRFTRRAKEAFDTRRELLITSWSETDESGEIKVRVVGNQQAAVLRNELEFTKQLGAVLKEQVEVLGEPPRAFTWDELAKFKEMPDADVIERLGPFVEIPTE